LFLNKNLIFGILKYLLMKFSKTNLFSISIIFIIILNVSNIRAENPILENNNILNDNAVDQSFTINSNYSININEYLKIQLSNPQNNLNSFKTDKSFTHFSLKIGAGFGYWFGGTTALTLSNTELDEYKKGVTYKSDLKGYFSKNAGIVVTYSSFNSRRNIDSKILDKINFTFIGGGLAFRNFINDGKLVFISTFVLGKVFFKNFGASYANYKEITASSLGYNISAGLDFRIYKSIYFGVDASILYGGTMKIKYDDVEYYTIEPIFYTRLDIVSSLKILF